MRAYKFRAWHTAKKVMFSPNEMGSDQLTLMPDGRGFVNVSGGSTRLSQFMPHMIPMQFTGLHDKNGKEIYEGDIVRATANGNRKYQIVWQDHGLGHWWIVDIQRDNLIPNKIPINLNAIEVIGNIYENTELIGVAP